MLGADVRVPVVPADAGMGAQMIEGRELPQNLEAERELLSAIIVDNSSFDRTADIVTAADFRNDFHRRVYAAMVAMNGQGIDFLTLREKMRELGTAKDGDSVSSIVESTPNIAMAERIAEIVRDASLRRRLVVECQRLQKAAFDNTPVDEIAAKGAELFAECTDSRSSGPQSIRRMITAAMNELDARSASEQWVTGVPSGISSLDEVTLGFQPGVLSIMGARLRVGKTATALAIALHVITLGSRVLLAEFDMSEAMIRRRMLAAQSRVSLYKLKTGIGISTAEMTRVARAASTLAAFNDALKVDHRSRDINALSAVVRRESKGSSLKLVIVDHIGHVQGGRGEKRYLQLGDVSSRLIDIADSTGVAVLALCQLGRDAETREPELADLRESGNLEQDARLVLLLDRPFLRGDATDSKGAAIHECDLVVKVAKNEGEAGHRINSHFALHTQRVTQEVDDTCRYCSHVAPSKEVMFA